jgi:hypothetical protein
VGVLPGVFAHSRRVPLDVAGLEAGTIEWRSEELDDLEILAHQLVPHGIQSQPATLGVADPAIVAQL